ncbi:hypothetical protein EUAN_09240 [Andreesenia angusta]|uniref:Copper amine oxidase-like N-terminal domain-containing protein n=1 Tax=Andreesenia angusta TaxID=39480 RepID=A0A1S1V6Y0_9FIRM|nr:stalk domain-containing protein [Andreesenia angusta]OHW62361.1 hypothetical protein EUAN_09240 [Andreesenia angusta]
MKRNGKKIMSLVLASAIMVSSGVTMADRDNNKSNGKSNRIYSTNELKQINEAGEKIRKENKGVSVISVEDIVSRRSIKFDTPPVIKENRTLVPVRAISEGFKAQVEWLPETKEVVIKKDDKTIVLKLGSNIALVNGIEKEIDSEAQAFSSRTYVPLRFIAEELGTKISYVKETGKIELDDDVDEIKEDLEESLEDLKEDLEELEKALKDEDKAKLDSLKLKIEELENELKDLDIDFESYKDNDDNDDDDSSDDIDDDNDDDSNDDDDSNSDDTDDDKEDNNSDDDN